MEDNAEADKVKEKSVLLILSIVFSMLSIIKQLSSIDYMHQLSFLYTLCSQSSTHCLRGSSLSEGAAAHMQGIGFTHNESTCTLQCQSMFMN